MCLFTDYLDIPIGHTVRIPMSVSRRLPLFVLVLAIFSGALITRGGEASAASAAQTLTSPVVAAGGVAVGTAALRLDNDGPLATATMDAATLSLPVGTYDLSVCLGAVPASAAVAQPCVVRTVTMSVAGRATAPSSSLTVYRPLDASRSVTVTAVLNVKLRVGTTTTAYATSWLGSAGSSLSVQPLTASTPVDQARGSNVHLFKDGVTLDDIARELDALQAAGATMVRTAFPWPLLQPQNTPTFDPAAVARVDAFLQLANERGLKVLAIFGSTPCWASSASTSIKAGCTSSLGDWAKYPTSSGSALQAAAREFGTRWGSQLAGVEYWNEPNNSGFFAAGAKA